MQQLTRFDAIYLLSLSQRDRLCPRKGPEETLRVFSAVGAEPSPGIRVFTLHLSTAPEKSAQAITIMVRIPEAVHILMRPEGGWIDVETLWHELGHGPVGRCHPIRRCPVVDRELATAFSLSEVYAFLLQRMALSRPVLESVMELPEQTVATMVYYRALKEFSVFRRYAAKFISELRDVFRRRPRRRPPLCRDHGPHHRLLSPAGKPHLFDLVPEFYCADYLLGWMGEALLADQLRGRFGRCWCLRAETGEKLKAFWRQGNQADIFSFFKNNGLGALTAVPLLKRWERLGRQAPARTGSRRPDGRYNDRQRSVFIPAPPF